MHIGFVLVLFQAVLAQVTCSKDSDCGQQNGCYKNYCISTDTSCDLFPKGCLSGFQCFGSICGLSPGCKKDSDCLDNAFACVSTQCILRSQRCDLFNSCLSGFTCIGRACVMGTGGLNGGSSGNSGSNTGSGSSNGGSSTSNPTPAPSVNTNSGSNSPSGSSSNSPNASSYPSITADNSSSGSPSTSSIDKGLLVAIVCGAIVAFLTVVLFVKLKERNQKKAQATKDAKLVEQQSSNSSTQSPYSQTTLLQNVTPMSQQTVPTFHSAHNSPSSQMSSPSSQSAGEMWENQSYPTNQMVQPTWNQQSVSKVPVNQSRFGIPSVPSNTGTLPPERAMYRPDHISNREEAMLPVLNPIYIEKPPVEQHFPPIIMQSTENAQFVPQQDINLPNAAISHGGADQEMPPVINFSVPIAAQHKDNHQSYSNTMPPMLDK